jgi:diaminohydroxyphosphoribosylaminopyrimidine deaminase/5-amino-6-(5-phosphoribosylamino)uracil reductase
VRTNPGVGAIGDAMRTAVALALDEQIRPGANPRVGCVLLDADGRVLSTGVHRGAGTPHAEADALSRLPVGDRARLHTAVVTLEPCTHTGRTPPCTSALLTAGVRRVVFGRNDPDPVAAGGAATLRAGGVEVVGPEGLEEALRTLVADVDPFWFVAARLRRPHVTWKFAGTLDGRVAAADGSSRWITSPQSRADAHRERCAADAVLAGVGTVLTDDSRLSVRDETGTALPRDRQPLRVVVGRRGLPSTSRVFDDTAATLQIADHDPARVLQTLWEHGCRRVFVEGGPRLAAAFWRAGVVDRVVCYLAPALLGAGAAAVGDLGITSIGDAARLQIVEVTGCGPDLKLVLRPNAIERQ